MKKAFFAFVETGVRACPLWDSERQMYVGMLTITDFIRILRENYRGPGAPMTTFEEQRLCDVKGIKEEQIRCNDWIHIHIYVYVDRYLARYIQYT